MLGISQSRNEKLSNVFYRLRLIEAFGTGIQKIIRTVRESRQTILRKNLLTIVRRNPKTKESLKLQIMLRLNLKITL